MGQSVKVPVFLKNVPRPWKILAPMVSFSEEAFRILVRRYGVDVCYTEMVNCKVFNQNKADPRKNRWYTTNDNDRPLVIQICGNDPSEMLATCLQIQQYCDAIDINLGCPQNIAKKGNYGSYLMDDFEKVKNIISTLAEQLTVPIFCKIRVFESIEKTITYAKMIEKSGCSLLAVHGRTREQKGQNTGYVSFDHIRAVKNALSIPVVSNGGVLTHRDIKNAVEITGCDGIMIGEPILFIPSIFVDIEKPCINIFKEYLTIVNNNIHSATNKHIKGHAFKILKPLLNHNPKLQADIDRCRTIDDYINFIDHALKSNSDFSNYVCKPNIRRHYLV